MDLDSAAEELYGVPAEEFTSHRDRLAAQAKADGDKALAASIAKLRKPVQAAALRSTSWSARSLPSWPS